MLPMLTRSRPLCGYCLFFTTSVYILSASSYMPFRWYALARLKHTAYVRSKLMLSSRPCVSRNLTSWRSFLPASFARSNACTSSPFTAAAALASSSWFTSFSIDFACCSGLSTGFLANSAAAARPWPRGSKGFRCELWYPAPCTEVIGLPPSPVAPVPRRLASMRLPVGTRPAGCRSPDGGGLLNANPPVGGTPNEAPPKSAVPGPEGFKLALRSKA
mmetsp:Transcript_4271/g.13807  ORF Transcript_4271/g.13807 Transcript_4271/m.13807 type:complete len:217 (+) Transcript_4271:1123-1773(+)